MQMYFMFA